MSDIQVYSSGLCYCSVCAPKEMEAAEVAEATNGANPTGLDHGWSVSSDPTFRSGQSNPCACEQDNSRRHWLLNC